MSTGNVILPSYQRRHRHRRRRDLGYASWRCGNRPRLRSSPRPYRRLCHCDSGGCCANSTAAASPWCCPTWKAHCHSPRTWLVAAELAVRQEAKPRAPTWVSRTSNLEGQQQRQDLLDRSRHRGRNRRPRYPKWWADRTRCSNGGSGRCARCRKIQ